MNVTEWCVDSHILIFDLRRNFICNYSHLNRCPPIYLHLDLFSQFEFVKQLSKVIFSFSIDRSCRKVIDLRLFRRVITFLKIFSVLLLFSRILFVEWSSIWLFRVKMTASWFLPLSFLVLIVESRNSLQEIFFPGLFKTFMAKYFIE